MIGFWLNNLVPPGAPPSFDLRTPAGVWTCDRSQRFSEIESDIQSKGACADTYAIEFQLASNARSSVKDAVLEEVIPICLSTSFVTGAAVTIGNPHPASAVQFVQVGSSFPRQRGIPDAGACVTTMAQFTDFVERFVGQYVALNSSEKLLFLTHFYIDALSCWSLENLYLSGSTLLQIIASTEEDITGRTFAAGSCGKAFWKAQRQTWILRPSRGRRGQGWDRATEL